jgi:hypothetical protein
VKLIYSHFTPSRVEYILRRVLLRRRDQMGSFTYRTKHVYEQLEPGPRLRSDEVEVAAIFVEGLYGGGGRRNWTSQVAQMTVLLLYFYYYHHHHQISLVYRPRYRLMLFTGLGPRVKPSSRDRCGTIRWG